MRDPWLERGARHGSRTWAQQKRQFRALRVPPQVLETVQQWAGSPDKLEPLRRLVRDVAFSNAVQRARTAYTQLVAGTARDPHYKRIPEQPGLLRPILDKVDRLVAELERLINWRFAPPIELHELDATVKPTRQVVRLSRLDESIREAFASARRTLLPVRAALQEATERHRGRTARLVQPFRVSALSSRKEPSKPARRRELERLLRDALLRLHPDRATRPRAARAEAAQMARRILTAIL